MRMAGAGCVWGCGDDARQAESAALSEAVGQGGRARWVYAGSPESAARFGVCRGVIKSRVF